jgi:hypothetical protein
MTYRNLSEVKAANKTLGHHWFDQDTIDFFGTQFHSPLLGGRFFVTSERAPHGPRAYSVRRANDDGSIDTVGDFYSYATREAAWQAAQEAAREEAT